MNPELVRYVRSETRKGKLSIFLSIYTSFLCLLFILNFTLLRYTSIYHNAVQANRGIFIQIIIAQGIVLLIAGGVKVGTEIMRERIENTIEFARITPVSAFSIAVGKLLGSPLLTYMLVGASLPFAVLSAIGAGIDIITVFFSYLLIFSGALLAHSAIAVLSTRARAQTMSTGISRAAGSFVGLLYFFVWIFVSVIRHAPTASWATFPQAVFQMTLPLFGRRVNLAATMVLGSLYLTSWNIVIFTRWILNPSKTFFSKKQSFLFLLGLEIFTIAILWNFFPRLWRHGSAEVFLFVFLVVSLAAIVWLLALVAPSRFIYLAGEIRSGVKRSMRELLWDESTFIFPLSVAKVILTSICLAVLLAPLLPQMKSLAGETFYTSLFLSYITWLVSILACTFLIQYVALLTRTYGSAWAIVFILCLWILSPVGSFLAFRGWNGMSVPAHLIASLSPPYAIASFLGMTEANLSPFIPLPALALHTVGVLTFWKLQTVARRKAKEYLKNPDTFSN